MLHFEPNNKKAQQELNELTKKLRGVGTGGEKRKGRRVQIEEEDEDSTEGTSTAEATPTAVNSATPPVYSARNDVEASPMNGSVSDSHTSQLPPSDSVGSLPPTAAQVPTPPPPLPPQVQALKDSGNEMFRAGQYGEAARNYSLALALLKTGGE